MEAARTSETSADNYFTRQHIPEDNSELHTRRRENLKSSHFVLQLRPGLATSSLAPGFRTNIMHEKFVLSSSLCNFSLPFYIITLHPRQW